MHDMTSFVYKTSVFNLLICWTLCILDVCLILLFEVLVRFSPLTPELLVDL